MGKRGPKPGSVRSHGRRLYRMSDQRLKERLAELSPESRLNVLLHVAMGWRQLRERLAERRGLTRGG